MKKGNHSNDHLQNAYDVYGKDNFIFTILLVCEVIDLTYYEQCYVDILNPEYNIEKECVTSRLGVKHTEDVKKEMSEKRKGDKNPNFGKHHTKDAKDRIAESRTGTHASDETKMKMSKNNKGMKGKHHTKETKDKIAAKHEGTTASDEARANMSKSKIGNKNNLGKHPSDKTRKKMSDSHKGLKQSQETKDKRAETRKRNKDKNKHE